MKSPREVEEFVAHIDIGTDSGKDRQVLGEILQAHGEFKHKQTHNPESHLRRILMTSNKAKFATAAAAILAVGLLVTILDRMATPAWAFGQTIEALKHVKGIYIAGRVHYPGKTTDTSFEIWARPHSANPNISGNFCYREGDSHLAIASESENVTYVYGQYDRPQASVVYITEGLNRSTRTFCSGDMLAEFKEMAEDWKEQYRQDPETGRDCVYVTFAGPAVNTAHYWQIQIDLKTKLPVRAAVWFDEDRQSKPHYEYTDMEYDPDIPESQFDLDVPENSQIVDCRVLRDVLDQTPGLGVAVDGLGFEEACRKVITSYWQAVVAKDWESVAQLRPLATGKDLSSLQALYTEMTPVELASVSGINHLDDPGTFAEVFCIVKLNDGTLRHSLLNVDIRETATGRVGVVAGVIGPEFYDAE